MPVIRVPAISANNTVAGASAACPRRARLAAITVASVARTATGLESGPAIAKGMPLPTANTIAMMPALTNPYPMPMGSPCASGPEKIIAA
jgi:stage V sporulation protein SpoVS